MPIQSMAFTGRLTRMLLDMIVVLDSERRKACPKVPGKSELIFPRRRHPRNVYVMVIKHPADTPQNYKGRLDVPRPGCVERGLAIWPFCKPSFNLSLLLQVLAPELYLQQPLLEQSLNDCVSQAPNKMLQISEKLLIFQLVAIFVAIFAFDWRLSALQLQPVQHQRCWIKDLVKGGGGTGSRCLLGIILEELFILRSNSS